MSRIHEALKRAEQEKTASDSGETLKRAAEMRQTMEPAVASILALPVVQEQQPEILTGPLRFEDLQERCARPRWTPDPNILVFCNSNPFPPGAEQFRTLRSRLYRIRENQPLHSILVTSSLPMEGKTTVAANLAHAIVRQRGCRALLIDADLRSPRLDKLLGAPLTPGLADYLQGDASETDVVQAGPEEGLFFIPAGIHVTHPAELISNGRLPLLLERLGPMFDWVIVDCPPVLPVSDSTVLAGMCDGVLFVVRAGATQAELAQKACQELKDARVIGVVLNTSDDSSGYESYYNYGKYGSHGIDIVK